MFIGQPIGKAPGLQNLPHAAVAKDSSGVMHKFGWFKQTMNVRYDTIR